LHDADMAKSLSPKGSRPSDSQLKKDFKFSRRPSPPQAAPATVEQPLTLSDIFPLPSHAQVNHDSVLNLILAHATKMPSEDSHMRLHLDSSSKQGVQEAANASGTRCGTSTHIFAYVVLMELIN
jgi:hypothetical protein